MFIKKANSQKDYKKKRKHFKFSKQVSPGCPTVFLISKQQRTKLPDRYIWFFFCSAATQRGPWHPHSWSFLDHTQRRTTVGRTPLDEWSARRRDLYLTTHNTRNRQISMPPVGLEPTISAGERPQTYALDRAATGTGAILAIHCWNSSEA